MSDDILLSEHYSAALTELIKQNDELLKQAEALNRDIQKSQAEIAALRADMTKEKIAAEVTEAIAPLLKQIEEEITEKAKKALAEKAKRSITDATGQDSGS